MSGRAQPIAWVLARWARQCTLPVLALIAVIAVAQCTAQGEPAFSIVQSGEM